MAHSSTPRSLCERYNDECYESLRGDDRRTAAFLSAIADAAPGRTCLDIGTGSLALLAVAAAKAGAKHTYAVESNLEAATAAREVIAAEKLEAAITVIEGFSTDVELPAPVDLLLHEIIGEVAGAEGAAAAFVDALNRHCGGKAPGSVPARARSLLAPAEFPPPEYFAAQPVPLLAEPGTRVLLLPALPPSLCLAPGQPFEDLKFDASGDNGVHRRLVQSHCLEFEMSRAATLRGLMGWCEIFTADAHAAVPEITSYGSARSSWSNVFMLLPEATAVERGDRILVRTHADLAGAVPTYRFDVALGRDEELHLGSFAYPEAPPPPGGWGEDECLVEFW